MSRLVEDLKHEHTLIADLFKEVKKLSISSKEGKEKLMAAKKGLLGHLKKEDDKLYPLLRKAAETNSGLKITLDLFAQEMVKVSAVALKFFDKYAKGEAVGLEFARDFGRLSASLGSRIRKEENILYAEYDKLAQE